MSTKRVRDFRYHQDPEVNRLWEERDKAADAGNTDLVRAYDRELADAVWKAAEQQVAADRSKHPKAKRNLPVGHESSAPTRTIP